MLEVIGYEIEKLQRALARIPTLGAERALARGPELGRARIDVVEMCKPWRIFELSKQSVPCRQR